nr:hypothetical protein KPHV_85980 [Kitasatospora purpeofusca]
MKSPFHSDWSLAAAWLRPQPEHRRGLVIGADMASSCPIRRVVRASLPEEGEDWVADLTAVSVRGSLRVAGGH